jgi:D-arginine dehydrogenase
VPAHVRWVIVGAGFGGAATAWALGRAGLGPGVILEQEDTWGEHASGRNAGMARLFEPDPVIGAMARRSLPCIRDLGERDAPLVRPIGGLTLAGVKAAGTMDAQHDSLQAHGIHVELLSRGRARARFPFLAGVEFETALWCRHEGVVDIHALLGFYLARAREAHFALHTGCRAQELLVEGGRVKGVHTDAGDIRGDSVVDASGAWAGRLGRPLAALPLRPMRRHVFVSASRHRVPLEAPLVWVEDAAFYFRPEGDGLLLSPCDETPEPPGLPAVDPAAAELLAEKITAYAPGLAEMAIRRAWACLRTFAPDRRPLIGADTQHPGLFHVSGLGGFGMMCSAAIGELAADLLIGREPDWIDSAAVTPARLADPNPVV